jgi:hypothetical protein
MARVGVQMQLPRLFNYCPLSLTTCRTPVTAANPLNWLPRLSFARACGPDSKGGNSLGACKWGLTRVCYLRCLH